MQRTQIIRCPNCGSLANRQFLNDEQSDHTQHLGGEIIRTECPVCDYLMVMRSLDGSVIEAYAPGISPARLGISREVKSYVFPRMEVAQK